MNAVALTIMFVLGIGNFAAHKAVLESGHPLLATTPWFVHGGRKGITLWLEFFVLLGAMLLVSGGWPLLAWAYGFYSILNYASAWVIVTGRV